MVRLLILADVNIPKAMTQYLTAQGHDVRLIRDELGARTPDRTIVLNAVSMYGIVITFDKDYQPLAERSLAEGMTAYRNWGLLLFHVPYPKGRARLEALLDLILAEARYGMEHPHNHMLIYMEVYDRHVVIHR